MTARGVVKDWSHRTFSGMAGDALRRVDGLLWSADEAIEDNDGVDALANALVAWHHVTLAKAIAARMNGGPEADKRETAADEYRRRVLDKIAEITAEYPSDDPAVVEILREHEREIRA